MKKRWHRYHYKNITYLIVSIIIAIFFLRNELLHSMLLHLGNLGYFGAFIAGILFVSTFTVSIGSVILLILPQSLHPLEIAIIAGFGAVLGDMAIFQFIRNRGFIDEVAHLFAYFGGDKVSHLLHTKYFSWTLPVVGALIIASPLPDELGISLIGISRLKSSQLILLSFVLNSIGIFLVVVAGTVLNL